MTRTTSAAAWLLALSSSGCAGLSARAAAPDERGDDRAPPALVLPPPPTGPAVEVRVESAYPATLVRLNDRDAVVERCPEPCGRAMPLDGTYRIDGPRIRSTWPFHLAGPAGRRTVVAVSPKLRSSYATAKTLGTVGGVAMAAGMTALLVGLLGATSAHDADNGSPAPCPGCAVAFYGGGGLAIAGIGLSVVAISWGIAGMSSGTSQRPDAAPSARGSAILGGALPP